MDLLALGIVGADLVVAVPWYWYAGLFCLTLVVAALLSAFAVRAVIDLMRYGDWGRIRGTWITPAIEVGFLLVLFGSFVMAGMKLIVEQPFLK